MVGAHPPSPGTTPQAAMAGHTRNPAPPPHTERQATPPELEEVILCALAKSPADRFRTAAEFAEALKAVAAGARPKVRLSATTMRAHAYVRRPAWRSPWAVALVVLVLLGASLVGWRLLAGARSPGARRTGVDPAVRRIAVLYFQDLSPKGELAPIAEGLTDALIHALSEVRTLNVVSRNGVAAFRRAQLPRDSIGRALHAGTLIEGAVEPEGDKRVRVSTRLLDGNGTDVGKRASVVV